jgi:hypothetical protein
VVKRRSAMSDGYFIDLSATDEFLDYPPLLYRDPDGRLRPPVTDEEFERLGELAGTKLQVPRSACEC